MMIRSALEELSSLPGVRLLAPSFRRVPARITTHAARASTDIAVSAGARAPAPKPPMIRPSSGGKIAAPAIAAAMT
jgi:hypothetical protein